MTTQPPATLLSRFTAVDIAVSSFLHRHSPFPYSLFLLLELSGDFRLFFPLVLSLYFSPVLLPFPPSSSLRYLLLGLILDIAVIGLVKVVFRRSRPSYNHSSSMSVAVHADNFSFPSGHASRVFLVATAIQLSALEIVGSPKVADAGAGPICGGWERVLLGVWTWAFATAASRVLLGRHYLCDVSHLPTLVACQCEGRGWKFWGHSNIKTKFWGQSIQLDPVQFDDGEIFTWSKVTTSINNLVLGKVYCDHHGTMLIRWNREYSCSLKFKDPTIFDRHSHEAHGFVEDANERKSATVFRKWGETMYYVSGKEGPSKIKGDKIPSNANLLWKSNKTPPNPTRYNLSAFAITLNELTPGLQEKLPPTDSRLRPDHRHLENGEYEKANMEKKRLEKRQRMSGKIQDSGWKPRWFRREGEDEPFPLYWRLLGIT